MIKATVSPLNEGYYTIGFDKIFHPFNPETDVLEDRTRGSLLVEIQPFLIQTERQNILLDAGLGFKNKKTGVLKIEENLAEQGLRTSDITDVVLSHLHKDHAGGLFFEKNHKQHLTFENAVHHINKKEFEYATDAANAMSYDTEKIKLLPAHADMQWLSGHSVFHFMSYEEDGGHCPHHTSFLINSDKGIYFFGGDVAPQIKQLKHRYIAKYDTDGRRSAELRKEYAQRGKAADWTFLFYHEVSIPMSKL